MIQDIEPHEYRNEYQPPPPDEDSIFLAYSGRTILAAMEGRQIRFYIWRNGSLYGQAETIRRFIPIYLPLTG